MIRMLKCLFFVVLSVALFSSCEKEYSVENGGINAGGGSQSGTAVFTLDGSPGACTTPSVLGSFKKGQTLTASDKVTLIVNVTQIGTYTISTGTVNGVTFKGSGTFTVTGPQFIELTATGDVPTNSGAFNYIPGTNGCSFSINYEVSSGSSSGTAVFTFKGAPNDCVEAVITGPFVAGTALTSASNIVLKVNVTTAGTYNVTTGAANGVTFSGTGTFASTGDQTITLTSTNTPAAAATVAYTPGTNGCSFNITYTAGTSGDNYLRCKIAGGALKTFNQDLTGSKETVSGITTLTLDGSNADNSFFTITLGTNATLTTGNYGLATTSPAKFNFTIYSDGTATWAGALMPTQTQTFTVNVTAITANRITGTFTGTLYDSNGTGTGTLAVTDGEFSVGF